MADLTQSYGTTATTTPQFYTDYLKNVAGRATAGADAAKYVGATPLQTQAFTDVAKNVGNYQPALNAAGANYAAAAKTNIIGAANPYLKAGTTTSGLTPATPYLTAGTTTGGLSQANPYLKAGTTTSGLSQANPYLKAGSSSAADLVGGYMNPYTSSVVDQIRLANQQNIAQNLSPAITSGAVGSGQFGSQRGANALSLGISNANIGALGLQNQALQTGYADAMKAAQQQRINQLNAGQTAGTLQGQFNTNQVAAGQTAGDLQERFNTNRINAGQTAGTLQNQFNTNQIAAAQAAANAASQQAAALTAAATGQTNLGQQQQQSGLADVNALATLGGQQQAIAQNKEMFPLDVAGKQMAALSGAQIPTSTMQTMTGSPLSAIAGLGALAGGMFGKNSSGTSVAGNIYDAVKPVVSDIYGGIKDAYNNSAYPLDPNANANYTGGPNADFDTNYPNYPSTGPTGPYTPNYQLPEYYEDY
jgi:hypothetical protein